MLKALYWGPHGAKKNYRSQIAKIVLAAMDKLGDVPVIIGETGVPMDIKWDGRFIIVIVLIRQQGTCDKDWRLEMAREDDGCDSLCHGVKHGRVQVSALQFERRLG